MIFKLNDEYINLIQVCNAIKKPDGTLVLVMSNGNSHTVKQPDAGELTKILDSFLATDADSIFGYNP